MYTYSAQYGYFPSRYVSRWRNRLLVLRRTVRRRIIFFLLGGKGKITKNQFDCVVFTH